MRGRKKGTDQIKEGRTELERTMEGRNEEGRTELREGRERKTDY